MSNYGNTFMQSEMAYRADRVRVGVAGRRRRTRTRSPLVRRPADTSDGAC